MKPRISLLISGLPRFGASTDTLISGLTNYQIVDWYVAFWKHDPQTMSPHDAKWQSLSAKEMAYEIQSRLPDDQNLRHFTWVKEEEQQPMPRNYPEFYNVPKNCWQQYQILQIVNNIKLKYEQEQGWEYDLVFRGRVDAGPDKSIDMEQLNKTLSESTLYMPANQRQGHYQFSDHWAIGRGNTITKLANAIEYFDKVHQQDIPYNAELMLGTILNSQGIKWPMTDVNSNLKTIGFYDEQGWFHQDPGQWLLNQSR